MFNNPFLNGFNNYPQGYPQFPQVQEKQTQPIQNIINTQMPSMSDYFMARFLKENQSPETELVTQKTAFIDLRNKKLSIKETDGTILSYEIILPLDEKDKKIMSLENEIKNLKEMINNVQSTDDTKSTKKQSSSTGNS